MKKTVKTSGADERTPSKSEYFSWINNTNEGSTEEQTLANLAYFKYLKDTYGMQLDIYAWDAGNLDGAEGTYERIDGEKITAQYPDGYGKVVDAAKQMGTRMGVWGGADGYGNTPAEATARRKMLVNLCKEYNWALFKFDAVCGPLRADKREEFAKTMRECRKYSPDLILLNHRNDLGETEKYATTFLWEGMETYVDVHGVNHVTAPHNRAYMFFRGHTPQNKRLTEDHGVCISSSVDFFEDDLVYQAFNRCLILAPEIYGNPWLMRDDELAKLARVFNLHRKYRDILINAKTLGKPYGNNAVSRGDDKRRFIATGNASWKDKTITVTLDKSIGLAPCDKVAVALHFPYEQFIGEFDYDSKVKITLPAFRATLIEVCDATVATPMPKNAVYEVLHETDGVVDVINLLDGTVNGQTAHNLMLASPVKIGRLKPVSVPSNAQKLYETACFGVDNDSLEHRSLLRSGETAIPQVQACRDMFFRQPSYVARGIECSIPFDGNPDTVFDTKSRAYSGGHRIKGGCLRVDFGKTIRADRVEVEFFDGLQNPPHVFFEQKVADNAEISTDLQNWSHAPLKDVQNLGEYDLHYYDYYVDKSSYNHGLRKKFVISTPVAFRYLRIAEPVDRIFTIKAYKGDKEIALTNPHLTNLFAHYNANSTVAVSAGNVTVPQQLPMHPYLAVAVEGVTGEEGVSVVAQMDGKLLPFPSRAPAYPANPYEWRVAAVDGNYTFFLPVTEDMKGKRVRIFASFANQSVPVDVYLCDGNGVRKGEVVKI